MEKGVNWKTNFLGKKGLDEVKSISKENKDKTYILSDDNNSNIGWYYLKNGRFAKRTTENPNYDFENNKTILRAKADVVYKFREFPTKFAEGGKLKKFFGKAKKVGGKAYEKGRKVAHYTKEAAKESMHNSSKRNTMGVLSVVKADRDVSNKEVDHIEKTEDLVQEHYQFEPTPFVPKKEKEEEFDLDFKKGGSVENDKWIEEGYYNKDTGVKIDEFVENISVWVHNEIHYKDLFINSKILDSIIGKPYLLEIDISRWQGHLGNSYQIEVAEFNLKGNDDYLTAEKKINYLNDIQYQRIKDIYNFKYSNSEWRFPTKIEMEAIYRNKDEIIGRIDSEQSNRYWIKKNTMNDGYTSVFDMEDGSVQEQGMKTSYFKLRLVRNFDTHTQSLYTPTKIIKSNILKDGGSLKKFPTPIQKRIDEINEMLPKVLEADDIAGGYQGGTMYSYVVLEKPIEVKNNFVYLNAKLGANYYPFEKRYNVNNMDFNSDNGKKALMYDLGIIRKAFKKLLAGGSTYAEGGEIVQGVSLSKGDRFQVGEDSSIYTFVKVVKNERYGFDELEAKNEFDEDKNSFFRIDNMKELGLYITKFDKGGSTYAEGGEIFNDYFDIDKVKSIENVEVFTNQRKGHKNYVRVDYVPLSRPQTMQVEFRKIPFNTDEELNYIKKTLQDNFASTYVDVGMIHKTQINEDGSNMPEPLSDVFMDFDEDEDSYEEMERLRLKANEVGYDFDYDLSGQPTEFWEIEKNKMKKGGEVVKKGYFNGFLSFLNY